MQEKYKAWDYYSWNNIFNIETIKSINETIEKNYMGNEPSEWATPWKNVSSVKTVHYGHLAPLLKNFLDLVQVVSTEGFGYNIFTIYNNHTLNYNVYNSKDKADYNWHRDVSNSPMFDTKLTLLINLSDEPYEGGHFEILTGEEPFTFDAYNKPGGAVMFKSHILHRVLPVTSGIRKSLALFITGPRFQ